ncbi:transcriptional regulator, LuxR family [Micromonospora echinofusca]|uniref:Transcriptional regulator, LuxR family n=1 Tax=Micromonospora echinofusca TaxID=47858 RepID=A0A1C5G7I6_MICEH|nr:LuxR family transcriptional regulator [Micromonospora echinofusca]SCG15648.1 transcriptional regulator, LuxR family [Micromonospora echinofusca]
MRPGDIVDVSLDWPLVGRDREITRLKDALLAPAGAGALLIGDAGVGKSRLASAALDACEHAGCLVERVVPTPGWQDVPFGAVVNLLPAPASGVADAFRQLTENLRERAAGRTVVIGVDDAQWLDDASVVVLERLLIARAVNLLVVARGDTPGLRSVAALRRAGELERIDVSRLNRSEVAALVTSALGARTDGLTLDLLWRWTLGNPLFLREVLRRGRACGELRCDGEIWRWHRADDPASLRLADLVTMTVEELSEPEREALTYVAYAEPIPLTMLEALVAPAVAERLEERGMLRLHTVATRAMVRLGHPLYGEAVRAGTGPLRARRVMRELAEVAEPVAESPGDRMQVVSWRCHAGLPVDGRQLLAAVEDALRRGGASLARRLAQHLPAPLDTWHTGRAAVAQGRPAEADPLLAAAYELLPEAADRARAAALRALNLFWGLRRPQDSLAVLAQATRQLPAEVHHELLAAEAGIAVFCGRGTEALDAVGAALSQPSTDPLLETAVTPLRPYLLVFGGAPGQAVTEFSTGDLSASEIWPTMRAATQSCHVHALVMCGKLVEATDVAERYYRDAVAHGSSDAVGLLAMMCGVCAGDAGRITEADRWTREALAVTDHHTLFPIRANILAMTAWWAAHLGECDRAAAALAEVATVVPPGSSFGDYTAVSEAWVLAASRHRDAAVTRLWELAERFRTSGLVSSAVEALHLLSRILPSPEVAAELKAVADLSDSPLFRWHADYAEHLAVGDPQQLEVASEQWAVRGYGALAVEAAAFAEAGYRRRCDAAASRLAHRLTQLRGTCVGFWPPWLPPRAPAAAALTRREREVCALAGTGLGNVDIAERLVLSVRTVENHLQRAYDKLGVRTRGDLAAALEALER